MLSIFRPKSKNFYDRIIADIMALIIYIKIYDGKEYLVKESVRLWIINGVKDELVNIFRFNIIFSINDEFQFTYRLKFFIKTKENEYNITNKINIIKDFHNLPLEVRQGLIENQNVVLEKS